MSTLGCIQLAPAHQDGSAVLTCHDLRAGEGGLLSYKQQLIPPTSGSPPLSLPQVEDRHSQGCCGAGHAACAPHTRDLS